MQNFSYDVASPTPPLEPYMREYREVRDVEIVDVLFVQFFSTRHCLGMFGNGFGLQGISQVNIKKRKQDYFRLINYKSRLDHMTVLHAIEFSSEFMQLQSPLS